MPWHPLYSAPMRMRALLPASPQLRALLVALLVVVVFLCGTHLATTSHDGDDPTSAGMIIVQLSIFAFAVLAIAIGASLRAPGRAQTATPSRDPVIQSRPVLTVHVLTDAPLLC